MEELNFGDDVLEAIKNSGWPERAIWGIFLVVGFIAGAIIF